MKTNQITLEKVSLTPPKGLKKFLKDLGDGENGFGGTPVANGKSTLDEFLQKSCDMAEGINLKPGLVPQTIFWVINADGIVVGMVRARHFLNDKLRIHGGHIGYYIHSGHRGKGYGKQALSLALGELRKLGETKALLTVNTDNGSSIRIVEANGGKFAGEAVDPDTGAEINKYWIELNEK